MIIQTGNTASHLSYGSTVNKATRVKYLNQIEIKETKDAQATVGPITLPPEELITPIEKIIIEHNGVTDYKELIKDPQAFRDRAKTAYEEFYRQASDVVAHLQDMDTTNSFTISFMISGVVVRKKEGTSILPGEQAWEDKKRIEQWIDDNGEEIGNIGKKGRDYAFAQGYIDYSNETGVTRNDALRAKKMDAYMGMVMRYALNGFGPNTMTYDEIKDEYGTAEYRYAGEPNKYSFNREEYFNGGSGTGGIRPGSLFNINM